MSLLSDREIKARISKGRLVCGARLENAEECSYAFRAGRAFLAGHDDHQIDFAAKPDSTFAVEPGKMVWIRTLEHVSLPNDLAGFWWQTNTLSKKGLMLVNMSMVEPGYEGYLACLFVNFGNQKIVINSTMAISKMVFMKISGKVDSPYLKRTTVDEYDSQLENLSVNQPSSFMQIGDISTSIDEKRSDLLQEISNHLRDSKIALNSEKEILTATIKTEFESSKREMISAFKDDAPKAIRASFGWAIAALILLGAITAIASWTKENLFEDTKKLAAEEAKKAVNERVVIRASTGDEQADAIERSLDEISRRLEKLEEAK